MSQDNKTHPVPPASTPPSHDGAHEAAPGEEIRSRSADPGQSSYGGFSNEDTRKQAQQLNDGDPPQEDAADTDGDAAGGDADGGD